MFPELLVVTHFYWLLLQYDRGEWANFPQNFSALNSCESRSGIVVSDLNTKFLSWAEPNIVRLCYRTTEPDIWTGHINRHRIKYHGKIFYLMVAYFFNLALTAFIIKNFLRVVEGGFESYFKIALLSFSVLQLESIFWPAHIVRLFKCSTCL